MDGEHTEAVTLAPLSGGVGRTTVKREDGTTRASESHGSAPEVMRGPLGTLRDELLDGEILNTLEEARAWIEDRRRQYNQVRPHSALGYRAPAPAARRPDDAKRMDPLPSDPGGQVAAV